MLALSLAIVSASSKFHFHILITFLKIFEWKNNYPKIELIKRDQFITNTNTILIYLVDAICWIY